MITHRAARPSEAADLTALCLRSKAVWGYDEAFMEACRAELTLTAEDLGDDVRVAEIDGAVVGLAQISVEGTTAELEKLFLEPDLLKGGVGRRLFEWAAQTARARGARLIEIAADPGAADFYRRMGAVDDGEIASESIPGRWLARFTLGLQ